MRVGDGFGTTKVAEPDGSDDEVFRSAEPVPKCDEEVCYWEILPVQAATYDEVLELSKKSMADVVMPGYVTTVKIHPKLEHAIARN
ncbi:hypothetical protein DPSP01_004934 [Paraphaeosphaeria sporulosa]